MSEATISPRIIEFGPRRVIGVSRLCRSGEDCAEVWHRALLPREGEIARGDAPAEAFGICRCAPGFTDGRFEYVAGMAATQEAPVPEGMIAVDLPRVTYAIFPVEGLPAIGEAWAASQAWLGASEEWQGYCSPEACDCPNHPSFEYYPPDFSNQSDRLFVYLPVRRK